MIMASPAMNQEVNDLVRSSEGARNAIQREDWGIAQRMLTEAQDRIGRVLREVDEKSRDVMMAPKPEHGDRG
jgi:hypothetical protein